MSAAARADSAYEDCAAQAQVNRVLTECGLAYLGRAQAELDAAWTKTIGLAKGQAAASLFEQQQAWMTLRSVSCPLQGDPELGREIVVLLYVSCRGKLIEQRAKELEAIGNALAN